MLHEAKPMKRPLRCPLCAKPITPEPVKVCASCHLPILRGHKYTICKGVIAHRHCEAPDSYLSKDEYIAAYGRRMYNAMQSVRRQFGRAHAEG